jgi:hypothetical protein
LLGACQLSCTRPLPIRAAVKLWGALAGVEAPASEGMIPRPTNDVIVATTKKSTGQLLKYLACLDREIRYISPRFST